MSTFNSTQNLEQLLSLELKNKTDVKLSKLTEVRNFLFYWNMFENKKCAKNCNWKALEKFSKGRSNIDNTFFKEVWDFMKNRYLQNSKVNGNFRKLRITDINKSNRMTQIIESASPSDEDKLLFCLYVIYRYRCNLFHGEKEPTVIWQQNDIFYYANMLLYTCLKN